MQQIHESPIQQIRESPIQQTHEMPIQQTHEMPIQQPLGNPPRSTRGSLASSSSQSEPLKVQDGLHVFEIEFSDNAQNINETFPGESETELSNPEKPDLAGSLVKGFRQ